MANAYAARAASSAKPLFHVMQQKTSAIDPGYFLVASEEIADEAALFALAKTVRRNQVLVGVNDAALGMLLKLTLERLGIAEDAPTAPMSVHDPAEDLEVIP